MITLSAAGPSLLTAYFSTSPGMKAPQMHLSKSLDKLSLVAQEKASPESAPKKVEVLSPSAEIQMPRILPTVKNTVTLEPQSSIQKVESEWTTTTAPHVLNVKQKVAPSSVREQWIEDLIKTLETPMYVEPGASFVSLVEADLPNDIEASWKKNNSLVQELSQLDSLDKKTYSVSFRGTSSEEKYHAASHLARSYFRDWGQELELKYRVEQKTDNQGLSVVFSKTKDSREYSLKLEYAYDSVYSGPMLFTNYVTYREGSWWTTGYYQGEGGEGYQKHIGMTDYSKNGNPNSAINKSFVSAFREGNVGELVHWWKLLSKCTNENYCRQSLVNTNSTGINLPKNYYSSKKLSKYSGEFHPLVMIWKETATQPRSSL
ncbi:hypothetical protein [Candidatus Mycoplasma haematominutum]|uniref:hypothetical protein n=1 Tax=Candidatus Mycoplasma haematominutum TaxID=209446 RepID=UPI0002EA2569|nr:hypothetical protein [Candidatus Mycoplasma haematominutum]